MNRTFSLPWANSDLDIHPDPPEGFHRVAVACGWNDAKKARERWPHAAVVGPLRTLRGIDLLVRGLLANPQIRVLVWDGPDLTPGEATVGTLRKVFAHGDCDGCLQNLGRESILVTAGMPGTAGGVVLVHKFDRYHHPWDSGSDWCGVPLDVDRAGGAAILPPPAPKPTARAPHGDPGDRIAGNTLADIWPRVLERVLTCGRDAPTQYGPTRELLNLMSVIRDPAAAQFGGILPHTYADVEAYYDRLTGGNVPEGAEYSYGSRLRGARTPREVELRLPYHTDQIDRINELLHENPATRAAFLTPWEPEKDCSKEAGRPCLVGVNFRAMPPTDLSHDAIVPASPVLHLTVCFRSHDLFGAYPVNLAAAALWLCETAKRHGMQVGTLTCMSMSAHVYERDYAAAQAVAEAYRPPPGPRWDPRTIWRVERTGDGLRATAYAVAARDMSGNVAPTEGDIVAVVEAKTPDTLARLVAESGLAQEPSAWIWLGREIERVWAHKETAREIR